MTTTEVVTLTISESFNVAAIVDDIVDEFAETLYARPSRIAVVRGRAGSGYVDFATNLSRGLRSIFDPSNINDATPTRLVISNSYGPLIPFYRSQVEMVADLALDCVEFAEATGITGRIADTVEDMTTTDMTGRTIETGDVVAFAEGVNTLGFYLVEDISDDSINVSSLALASEEGAAPAFKVISFQSPTVLSGSESLLAAKGADADVIEAD